MSRVMLHGVLDMPISLWGNDPVSKIQRHGRYVEASRIIAAQDAEIASLKKTINQLRQSKRPK